MTRLTAQLNRYASGQRMGPHTDGCRRLSVVVAGGMLESNRIRVEHPHPGSVALKASRLEHADRFGENGALILSVLLPDTQVRKLGHDPDRMEAWRWRHSAAVTLAAWRLAAGLCAREAGLTGSGLDRLLPAFSSAPMPRGPVPARVRRVLRILDGETAGNPDAETRPPTPVEVLAEREGIHPVSLGRLFHRHVGCSITRHRRRLRVHAAARCLMDTGLGLVEVALRHGYADVSHMTRHFTAELGVPPGGFRRTMESLGQGLDSFKTEWTVSL